MHLYVRNAFGLVQILLGVSGLIPVGGFSVLDWLEPHYKVRQSRGHLRGWC